MVEIARRIAVIDRSLCIRERCGYVCINVCPVNRMNKKCVYVDDEGYPVIEEVLCTGCGICPKKCPVRCIKIINIGDDLEIPVHQYGVNSFRLYSLPIPRNDIDGAVAIIGKNGIGKTTALKILSLQISPNFGEYEKQPNISEVLKRMPPEMKHYFEKKASGEISVSVKPQNIESLRDYDITVSEACIKFGIKLKGWADKFAERKLSNLSGGELQTLSIEIAKSKKANIYYFDEITNYLDIAERLKKGLEIREFSKGKTVLLVDHDLTVLDYISDYLYVFYGEENAYGVVSTLKSTRTGINEYLGGYLKAENRRIRNEAINFMEKSADSFSSETMVEYPPISISFSGFEFSSPGGEIKKEEVIGIVGKNALGKSLFLSKINNIMAEKEMETSYKPQYLERVSGKVKDRLMACDEKDILNSAIQHLDLSPLMEKEISELSGGELQRVEIAKAISSGADLILLDEPTAFLDVENRLALSRLLKNTAVGFDKSIMVIDHDIIFMDFVSNRMVVFSGESSVKGEATKPMEKKEGMNRFFESVDITIRKDRESGRPRINKPGSVLDREQREKGEYYS